MTDAFNLASAQIVNAPDVSSWPATTAISRVEIVPGGDQGKTIVTFDKQDGPHRWPDVVPTGWDGPLQYTLWLFLNLDGRWVGSAFIQFWYGLEGSGGSVSNYLPNWYYGHAWDPMSGHVIQQDEPIAYMVTAGSLRAGSLAFSVHERSNIVVIPATDHGVFTFDGESPVPPQPPVPTDPSGLAEVIRLLTSIDKNIQRIAGS